MALLEVHGLVKYYGKRKVVDGVNFVVEAGEVVGLLGPNGAGKTTSFRMTTGQLTPNDGFVSFNGNDVTKLPMYQRARLGMGYLPQEHSIFRKLTTEQNILAILEMVPMLRSLGRRPTRAERRERTEAMLEQFGLAHVRNNNSARLSGGEKRRLEIARCLVCEPLLILLDEPFTGIDPITIADIRQIVRALRDQGIGMLLTDHNVREALKITDRSYLIKSGQVRTHGSPAQIVRDPIAINEYLGQDFSDNSFEGDPTPAAPYAPAPTAPTFVLPSESTYTPSPARAPALELRSDDAGPTVPLVLENEKLRRAVERLKSPDAPAAAQELVQRGAAALPALFEALERRDLEMRRQAFQVLQIILNGAVAFDPYAPEALRRQQIANLREQHERKAG